MRVIQELWELLKYWRKHPLASNDYWGTVGRFLRWQVGARLIRAPIIYNWIDDARLVVEKGMTGATMNMYCGLHEFHDMAFVLHFIKPGDRFLDIGANVGSYTVLAGKICGARVISIEPVPGTFEKLIRNVKINGLEDRVVSIQVGVGPVDGELIKFTSDNDTMNQVASAGYSGGVVDVQIRTLNNISDGFSAVMWKMDVEGFEEAALMGGLTALQNPELLVVQLEGISGSIIDCMHGAGFCRYTYDPRARELAVYNDENPGHNWLWIKNKEVVEARCAQSAYRSLLGVRF
jgi:FkbM family methyltransferase